MKRLVLILIVVLILFGIMLTCGLTRDHSASRASDRPSWMGLLDPLRKKAPVTAAEILPAPCFVQGDLLARPNQPCTIHVRTSQESDVRTMKLAMVAGASSRINLQTHGQTGMEIEIPLHSATPKSPELQIPKEGAEVKVTCVEPAPDPAAGSSMGQAPGCRLRMTR
jgi:hypothetical protein